MSIAAHRLPPPLRDGDRLTRDEFMRRWEAMPDLKHAELIDGIVYMASPVSYRHDRFHTAFLGCLSFYAAYTPGCVAGSEGTWLMAGENAPQPDTTLRILPECGGQSGLDGEYSRGAPELVIEVALSSSSRDRGAKLRLYERMQVREYLVAMVGETRLLWHELALEGFRSQELSNDEILRSQQFPGLWLDCAALWRLDQARLFAVIQEGVASPEHAEFVKRLAERKG